MILHRWGLAGLLLVAAFALWLLLAGPTQLLGIDTGNAGMVLLVTATWVSLYAVGQMPREAFALAASPGEWKAWIGTAFMAAAVAYFLSKSHVFAAATVWNDPDAGRVARDMVLLLVAWAVLSGVLAARWKGAVEEDERDHGIAAKAVGWGRMAMVVFSIGLAVTLGLSPAHELEWATHIVIANLLILGLMLSWMIEYAATAVHYWRARH